jgi:signal transduction histidine kinase
VRRREYVLNSLLCGISAAGVLALIASVALHHFGVVAYRDNTNLHITLITIVTAMLWRLSRSCHYRMSAYLFLSFMGALTLYSALAWSFELPSVSVLCALLILFAGMVVGTQGSITITITLVALYLVIGYGQARGMLVPDTAWLKEPIDFSSCVDYAILLGIMGLVSWLGNKETDHFLKAAQQSHAELLEERNGLEEKIMVRTNELEQAQLARTLELQRFADFGRLNAHLLHEITNPLTAAAIHLELLGKNQSTALTQARRNIHQLERYINAARKQLKTKSNDKEFTVVRELKQVLSVIAPIARRANVKLVVQHPAANLKLYGDPVKFNQILANIIVNAIEAYGDARLAHDVPRQVLVSCEVRKNFAVLTVRDWGKGIAVGDMAKLFEPFFTTKSDSVRGLGIGLSLVKQTVEQDFSGTIDVDSSVAQGTTFTIKMELPNSRTPNTRPSRLPARTQNDAEPTVALAF